jgi:hypothetical protein
VARLVEETHKSARKWVDAERQVKFSAMDFLSQRQEKLNLEFEQFKKKVDDDVIGFISHVYEQK